MKKLKEDGVPFHSYQTKESKTKSYKAVPNMDVDDIKRDLTEKGVQVKNCIGDDPQGRKLKHNEKDRKCWKLQSEMGKPGKQKTIYAVFPLPTPYTRCDVLQQSNQIRKVRKGPPGQHSVKTQDSKAKC